MSLSTEALVKLHSLPGVGAKTIRTILQWVEDRPERMAMFWEMGAEGWAQEFRFKANIISALQKPTDITGLVDALGAAGFQPITYADYPAHLRDDELMPPLIYWSGNLALWEHAGIAFSGSRHTAENGLAYTRTLSELTVQAGLSVIAGQAGGVDMMAHQTALEQGGTTVIVAPEGALNFRLNPLLRDRATADNLLVISEFPPKMGWSAGNAMQRNRTIIALSKLLLIIEAGDSGGTLSAGRTALKHQRPVYVLDRPDQPAGNRILLSEGARALAVDPPLQLPSVAPPTDPPESPQPPTQLSLF